jgi:nucleotide-binding universal stress UspA family protein
MQNPSEFASLEASLDANHDATFTRWAHPAIILVATDLTDFDRLMPYAFEQAAQSGARLVLLHVLATGQAITVDASGLPHYDPTTALAYARSVLEPWCETARKMGVACDALVREGNIVQQASTAVSQFKADRLILGTRGKSRIKSLFLGSIAEHLLRSVNVPVLTVGPDTMPPGKVGDQPLVLFATTLRTAARSNAALAWQIAASQEAKLLLLHILPSADQLDIRSDSLEAAALDQLRALTAEMARQDPLAFPVEFQVAHGNPAIEILSEADKRQASLIVMGATEHTVFDRIARESVLHRVLSHARCSVLTLHQPVACHLEGEEEKMAFHH